MKCVAVVTFDLELGQKMEYCFPNGVELSEQERSEGFHFRWLKIKDIYAAFPISITLFSVIVKLET